VRVISNISSPITLSNINHQKQKTKTKNKKKLK
jgi:hypothetical protein